ncbi:hypothetical protein ACA910_010202 [Epithemia clementina (nom. ined.)]
MRRVRSALSNYMHATPDGVGGFTMTDGRWATHATTSSTNTIWFKQFMDGCHEHMGDVKIQDTALSIDIVLALQELLNQSWLEAVDQDDHNLLFETALLGTILSSGFSSGLCGEELGHMRLQETITVTTLGLKHPCKPHIVLSLEGRFKGQVSRKKKKIPLCLVPKLGIQNSTWLLWLISRYEHQGILYGPLVRIKPTDQKPASIKQMDMILHKYLLALQAIHPDVIPELLDVANKFSVRRSLRRGSTLQAWNAKVPKEVITLNNRWQSEEMAGNRFAGRSEMLKLYTDALAALETILQYSEPL